MAQTQIPKRLSGEYLKKFKKWLINHACLEEIPATNEYELFRFNYENGVFVLYKNSEGCVRPNCADLHTAYHCYRNNKPFPWKPKKICRQNRKGRKNALIKRDGDKCFFCGGILDFDLPSLDPKYPTIEHLLNVCHGGGNRIENQVLAHRQCNEKAKNASIMEKVKMRERLLKSK